MNRPGSETFPEESEYVTEVGGHSLHVLHEPKKMGSATDLCEAN